MENKIVVKSNFLIEASYKLSAQEQWIILFLTSVIKIDDKDFKDYTLSVKEFAELAGIHHKGEYEDVKEITKKLISRVFTIKKHSGTLQVSWLSSAEYHNGKGTVTLRFDPGLKPYLLQLQERFTKYSLHMAIKLKSAFSIRFYELLKQYEKLKERTFLIDDLKEKLGIERDQYKLYGHFKAKVLIVAQEELAEKTDISFEFEEIKIGRGVGKIRFLIKVKPQATVQLTKPRIIPLLPAPSAFVCKEPIKKNLAPEVQPPQPKTREETGDTEENFFRLVAMLPPKFQKLKSVQNVIQRYLREYDFDFVARNIKYANAKSNAVKPGTNPTRQANYCAYLSKTLAGDFGLPFQENEEMKTEEKALEAERRRVEEERKRKETERKAIESENRAKAEAIMQTLSSEKLEELRRQAIERLPAQFQNNPYASMMIKIEMQKLVLERETGQP